MRFETIHAVTYFGAESSEAAKDIGLDSWWKGYFAFRSAPFGRCTPGVIDAAFQSFSPPFVRRWIPSIWDATTPGIALATRSAAAARTLRRVASAANVDVVALTDSASPLLEAAIPNFQWSGRPVFAANLEVPLPDDPIERLWQLCTLLREHRGDGHVIACTAAGLSGLQAHVLIAVEQNNSFEDLARTRGWTTEQWNGALESLRRQGLVGFENVEPTIEHQVSLTDQGYEVRTTIESTTDALASAPFDELPAVSSAAETPRTNPPTTSPFLADLTKILDPLAHAVASSGTIRYPNPMGLSALK